MGVYLRKKSLYSVQKTASCVIFFTQSTLVRKESGSMFFLNLTEYSTYLYMLTYTDMNSICHTIYVADICSKHISVAYHEKPIFKRISYTFFSTSMYNFVICYSYFSYNRKLFLSCFIKFFFYVKGKIERCMCMVQNKTGKL